MAFTISSFVEALFETATSFGGLMKCINFAEWLLSFLLHSAGHGDLCSTLYVVYDFA